MKSYSTLHRFNIVIFFVTLGLYLTVIFGLLAQIVLGAMQVCFAIFLLTQFKHLSQSVQKLLLIYTSLVLVYLSCFFLYITQSVDFIGEILLVSLVMVVPMAIAGFFCLITRQIKTEGESIDRLKTTTNEDLLDDIE